MSGATDTATDLARLGALIRERRHSVWLPMAALASQAGISRSTLHRIERMGVGHRAASPSRPTPRNVAAVLNTLGIRPAQVAEMVGAEPWALEVLGRLGGRPPAADHRERWMRPEDAAKFLGISAGQLSTLKRQGLTFHRPAPGAVCLFLPSELKSWGAAHARLPSESPPPRPRRPRYRPRQPRCD